MTMMTMKMLINDKKSTIKIEMNTDINAIKILMLNTGATRKATDKDTHEFTYIVRLEYISLSQKYNKNEVADCQLNLI